MLWSGAHVLLVSAAGCHGAEGGGGGAVPIGGAAGNAWVGSDTATPLTIVGSSSGGRGGGLVTGGGGGDGEAIRLPQLVQNAAAIGRDAAQLGQLMVSDTNGLLRGTGHHRFCPFGEPTTVTTRYRWENAGSRR